MSIRRISKSFYRSGFRGWMRGVLSIHTPHPKPGNVTGKAVALGFVPSAEFLAIDIKVKTLTIKGEAVI